MAGTPLRPIGDIPRNSNAIAILLPHRPYYPNDWHSMMTDHADATHAIVCPLHAGDAVIHGPLTLHAASANRRMTSDARGC